MVAGGPGSSAVKLAAPVLYVVTFLLTTVLNLNLVLGDPLSWSPGLNAILSLLPGLIWGLPVLLIGMVLGFLSMAFLRLEQLQRPTVLDHLRKCALLYAILVLLASVFFGAIYGGREDMGDAIVLVAMLSVAYAILIDALVLGTARLRSGRTNSRGAQ